MRTIFFTFITLIVLNANASDELKAFQIFTEKGKKVDFGDIVKGTEGKEIIFFGELHNNTIAHWLQLELTKALYTLYKKNLVIGGEMFEADNQYIIDEYLADQISQKNFHDEVRLWPNYGTDYQPLLEYAHANKFPFIATNIPRRYANMVYKKGLASLNDLSDEAKRFITPLDKFKFDASVECYKNLIMDPEHGGENMAIAQAIKDATMSHFILKNRTNKNIFLHFNGAYHSDHFQGILVYLLQEMDKEKVLTISTVSQIEISKLDAENMGKADFIICVPENMTTTH